MLRSLVLTSSLFASLTLASATAIAAPAGGFYTATPVTAPAVTKAVARDIVWSCDGGSCSAGASTSRAAIVCAVAVRELGPLTSFSAGSDSFDAAALEKCNAKAR